MGREKIANLSPTVEHVDKEVMIDKINEVVDAVNTINNK